MFLLCKIQLLSPILFELGYGDSVQDRKEVRSTAFGSEIASCFQAQQILFDVGGAEYAQKYFFLKI